MTRQRRELPTRRHCETFELAFGNLHTKHIVSLGLYANGEVGEVFINFPRSGLQAEAIGRDAAVLISLCLQYGVPLTVLSGAVTRDPRGEPSSIVGAVLDTLAEEKI